MYVDVSQFTCSIIVLYQLLHLSDETVMLQVGNVVE